MIWLIVILVFSVLILVHEAGHLFAAKRAGIRVEAFSLGMGKRLCGIKIGETDYRLSLIPFGGFCKMAGEDPDESKGADDEFGSKPVVYRFWVIAAGSLTNYIFAFFLFWVIFMIGVPTMSNQVGEVMKGYPAEKAGLEVGDRIDAINDTKIEYWDDILKAIKAEAKEGQALDLLVTRGDRQVDVAITPDISTVTNVFGQQISRPVIGIRPQSKVLSVKYGPFKAAYYGGKHLIQLTGMTYKGIWLLITGGMPVKTSMSGPIGIAHIMGEAAKLGIVPLLIVTAHVNMALAIFNLLPFPVLDGGHIIFLAVEKIRRKPVSMKVQEVLTQVALVALIAFALFVSWNDITRLTPLGKDKTAEQPVEAASEAPVEGK